MSNFSLFSLSTLRLLPKKIIFFLSLYSAYLFTPLLGLLFFKAGFLLKYHQINSSLTILFIMFSILTVFTNRVMTKMVFIVICLFVISVFSFTSSLNSIFEINTIESVIGMFALYFGPQFIGLILVYIWLKLKSDDFIHTLFFYSGLFIAVVNIIIFILLYSGRYELIYGYTEVLGLGDYFLDLGSFFIRPAGYFFDTHSQYYMPLFSFVLLVFNKVVFLKKRKLLYIVIIIVSILMSGVKTAYLTLGALLLFWTMVKYNKPRNLLIVITLLLLVLFIDSLMDNVVLNLINNIFTHDINIYMEHLYEVPKLIYDTSKMMFFFGGQPNMANYIYSELYYVTLIYYIGIVGVFSLYVLPMITVFIFSKQLFIKSIVLIFALSLAHYSVFKIGVNMIATSYIYYIFYKFIFNFKTIK